MGVVQYQKYSVIEKMRGIERELFSPMSCLHHYVSMAKGNFREYLQRDEVKIKKYFYVLRPILAAKWIEEKNEIPPMRFQTLLRDLDLNNDLRSKIETLLDRKMAGEELRLEPKIEIINDFLNDEINRLTEYAKGLKKVEKDSTEQLNVLFRQSVKETWG